MKSKLIKGALFVTIATFLVKILSIVYKIPYQNLTGDKGFYIYQQMYPLFALLVALSQFAIPLALSESANEQNKENTKIFSSSFYVIFVVMTLISFFIILFNPYLGYILGDKNLSPLFYPLIPVLFLVPLASVLRGYLYSNVQMIHHVGISVVIEQIFRIGFILFILYLFVQVYIDNLYTVAFYSFYGFGIGLLVATFLIFPKFNFRLLRFSLLDYQIGVKIVKRGLFLLVSASVLILLQLVDSLTIINSLTVSSEKAMEIKGVYDRGLPLIQASIFFVSPLLSSIIPHIHKKEDYGKLLMFIFFLALPATVGLIIVLKDLNLLLFTDTRYTNVLQVSVVVVLLYALLLTLAAINKNSKIMTLIILMGLGIKLFGNLTFIHFYGIIGASISSVLSLFIMLGCMIVINRKNFKIRIKLLLKIIFSTLFMLIVLSLIKTDLLIINILIGMGTYILFSFLFSIKKADFMINYHMDA